MRRIRGHGLFDDDMSVLRAPGEFSFYNIFRLCDFLVQNGMRPILELSFVPEWLASTNHTVTHYKGYASPPNNLSAWENLNFRLGQALIDRYGLNTASQFRFEVWNERECAPQCPRC
jgi:xylan 1,4-beta-xylosidase